MGYQADSEKVPIGTDHSDDDPTQLKHFTWSAAVDGSSDTPLKEVISGCLILFRQVHEGIPRNALHIDAYMMWEDKDDLRNYQENRYSLYITAEECPTINRKGSVNGSWPALTRYRIEACDEDGIDTDEDPPHRFSAVVRIAFLH